MLVNYTENKSVKFQNKIRRIPNGMPKTVIPLLFALKRCHLFNQAEAKLIVHLYTATKSVF